MAREQEPITVQKGQWIELTNSDVSILTFQVLEGEVEILRSAVQPAGAEKRGWLYGAGEGERAVALDEIAATGGARVWALGMSFPDAIVLVDHA
ncbi:hypothetical protein [Halocynthiibacter styelae]|uniref:Uncharacterized protein n=1 Tax=Halocynthiibacter styelae TaxID=2761955 RepID=A0A8J7IZR2_9RHOB|nr:hypothetical protein [Paenihalocynthiibacter styelae]MBI1495415.1 hypothetical protein [Paenihalocynthiibacter styelae]